MENLLEKVNSPDDLKKLTVEELKILAGQIRQFLLNSVSRTGGHLASSLGVVELTMAMHYVFDFKSDKLLWDVGHQCYVHKVLTGRKEGFKNLRRHDGISGFPNPEESEYDPFSVGHAGTSISTAIGMAIGKQKQGQNDKIVSLVGDACIVNGTSFEALNNLGLVKRQMLIVLNDNSMAIDQTEGAVATYFSKIRLSHTYESLRKTTSNILEHIPVLGKGAEEALEKFKKSIRMVQQGSQMFESLNVPYFGPVDGHDIGRLIKIFEALSGLNYPAILHVYTKKGKGFTPANDDPSKFHSTGPFVMNGDTVEREEVEAKKSFTSVFGERLVELAEKDDRIVAITSAMCDGTGLGEFRERFPDRFYDVGIAESAAVDIAAGLAKTGLKPVVCIYSTFLQRSFDQIFQEVSLQNLPVVFCIDRAGVVGFDGPTHHGMMDIGYLRMLPNVIVAAPGDEQEMRLALDFALAQDKAVCLRYPKEAVGEDDFDRAACGQEFEAGKSVTLREGKNSKAAIVCYGSVLTEGLKAWKELASEGIGVDVINARFASPVDEKIISLLRQGKSIITVEDHGVAGGFGSAVLEAAAADGLDMRGKITLLGAKNEFIRHDCRKSQLNKMGVTAESIVRAIKRL